MHFFAIVTCLEEKNSSQNYPPLGAIIKDIASFTNYPLTSEGLKAEKGKDLPIESSMDVLPNKNQ